MDGLCVALRHGKHGLAYHAFEHAGRKVYIFSVVYLRKLREFLRRDTNNGKAAHSALDGGHILFVHINGYSIRRGFTDDVRKQFCTENSPALLIYLCRDHCSHPQLQIIGAELQGIIISCEQYTL